MVTVKDLSMWSMSVSMLFNKSPKIEFICGNCNSYSTTRISMTAIERGKPYVICPYCGEINDTRLKL